MAVLARDPTLTGDRLGLVIVADKGSIFAELDAFLAARAAVLQLTPRPRRNGTRHSA